tara:strand:+ start:16792 stop:17619 length:828 start_codon:yes stop_codon:yes gene_type:complete
MPYVPDYKTGCVYKKNKDGERGEKVGCTDPNKEAVKKYLAALYANEDETNEGKDPKKGTGKKPKGSGRRLYTDENPSDTVGVSFKTASDVKKTLAKKSLKSKPHKRQSQVKQLIKQRACVAAGRAKDPQKKKNLRGACDYAKKRVAASKKKTQRMKKKKNESLVYNLEKIFFEEIETLLSEKNLIVNDMVSKNINIAESKLEEIIQEETANVLIKKAIEAKKNADRSFEEGYYDAARIYINSAINLLQKTIKTSGSQEAKKLLLQFKIFKNDHRL